MSDNILDEVEVKTGPRTCPDCGYQLPYVEFVRRFVLSRGLLKFACQDCGELVKCDFIKIQVVWLIGLFVSGFLFYGLVTYFDLEFPNIVFLIFNLGFVLVTLNYMKFKRGSD